MGRPAKYASAAERQQAYRQRYKLLSGVRVEKEIGETIALLASELDVSQSEVVASLIKFALLNRNWRQQGLFGKRLPHANPIGEDDAS